MTKKLYEKIEDFLSKTEFNQLKKLLSSNDFPWYVKNFNSENCYFYHVFYDNDSPTSPLYNGLVPILIKLKVIGIIKIEAIINLPSNNNKILNDSDIDFSHFVSIFNINTNDGYLLMGNGDKIESKENQMISYVSEENLSNFNCNTKNKIYIKFSYF